MKKITVLIAAILLLLTLSALPTYAAEVGPGSDVTADEPADSTVNDGATAPETGSTDTDAEDGSATQAVSAWLTDHFGDITGAVSSIGLAVLTWFISKRLIPAVKEAIKSVATKSAASESAFSGKVDGVAAFLESGVNKLEECEVRLNQTREELQKRIDANAKAYELQTDLINYLFLNLRIPNELKTEIAKKSEEVKAAIKDASKE